METRAATRGGGELVASFGFTRPTIPTVSTVLLAFRALDVTAFETAGSRGAARLGADEAALANDGEGLTDIADRRRYAWQPNAPLALLDPNRP